MTQKKRILSIDILRGLGLMVIVVIHRLHYHWTGMRNKEVLREFFSGGWAPLLIAVIALFTMAGIFYFITGIVNSYSFYKRIEAKKTQLNKVIFGAVVSGFLILLLNYIHRLFFMNGFNSKIGAEEPEFPAGFIIGWLRNPDDVRFYWSQISEPGTLAVIGLIVIFISLLLGILLTSKLRDKKKRVFRIITFLGFVFLIISPFIKYYLRPEYEACYEENDYLAAFLCGYLCQEFSLFPYLGYGLIGSVIGLSLAMKDDYKSFQRRNRILSIILISVGIALAIIFDKRDSLGKWFIGAGICYIELGIFILFLTFLIKKIDNKITKKQYTNIRSFGMLALTVYFMEPIVAELFVKVIQLISGNSVWMSQIQWVLLFGFFLLAFWTIVLHYWRKKNYIGSLEWLFVKLMFLLVKKQSSKTEFSIIEKSL